MNSLSFKPFDREGNRLLALQNDEKIYRSFNGIKKVSIQELALEAIQKYAEKCAYELVSLKDRPQKEEDVPNWLHAKQIEITMLKQSLIEKFPALSTEEKKQNLYHYVDRLYQSQQGKKNFIAIIDYISNSSFASSLTPTCKSG